MFPYWLLFGFFASGALLATGRSAVEAERTSRPLLLLGGLLVALMIGLRFQVGADWESYRQMFAWTGYVRLERVLNFGDPGYQLLNWTVQQVGGGLWLVNLVAAAVFAWGLVRFAQAQSDPWLAMVVAVPYLIIVVGMGYTRQAMALGVLMAGLASVIRGGSVLRFAVYALVAAVFHRTAIAVLPLVIFAAERNRLLNLIAGTACFILLYDLMLAPAVEGFVRNYIEAEYSSQGAAIRIAMSVIPAVLFLLRPSAFGFSPRERRMWRLFSFAAIACLVLLFVLPSSTAVDRLALYLLPLQVAVFARATSVFTTQGFGRALVVLYALAVQFVWLNFATHAQYWVPYRLYPL
ncbi:EpsG family protein [Sphingomonas arenae]|uniref:EpsG family protein n=1 Tax=Sphingomonas arenae TaxID=2812555 RepID=UPI001966F3A0|nr:EpsG family protein [Sphingomonas arenae]